ncbi:hypothetical protein, partial [Staphylococcus aureus]|uniref:hypothetical protein n=1 Tax=Staphylococcus aureus TaxID=1280 RepID=UPI001F47B103
RPALSELSSASKARVQNDRSVNNDRSANITLQLLPIQRFLRPSLPGSSAFAGPPDQRIHPDSTPVLAEAQQPDFHSL